MSALFGNIIFMNPWILSGMAALPLLWYLLRIMPPMPRRIPLPTTRFLTGLVPGDQTPSHTPWWILLLRIVTAALVLAALAHPIYNPAEQLPGRGAVRLVIDNSWPSAQTWNIQTKAAEEVLSQAGREKREVYLLTTAPAPGEKEPVQYGPMGHGEGLSILRGLEPLPWPADYRAAKTLIEKKPPRGNVLSLWLAHGLDEGRMDILARSLQTQGELHYIAPPPEKLPILLQMPKTAGYTIKAAITAPKQIPAGLPVSVQAMAENGRILDHQNIVLSPETIPHEVTFDIPEALRNDISQFRIGGRSGAGGIFLLDESSSRRFVGIAAPSEKSETAPLIEAGYYLKRALEPYTTLTIGAIGKIIEQNPSVIILPDIGAMPAGTLESLEQWVKDGGLLLRFAGPNMTRNQGENYLVPVRLRKTGRSLEGSLTWHEPLKLAAFSESSPFYGFKIPDDVTVTQQILPELSQNIEDRTWASLSDGTPLITASPLEQGMLVLVHTTTTPEWSDFALSGLFVQILRRIVSISGSTGGAQTSLTTGNLEPLLMIDGFGNLKEPASFVQSIPAADLGKTMPGPTHPPGLYGGRGTQAALNIGTRITALKSAGKLPSGVIKGEYGTDYEHDLMPYLLYAALILLLADWLLMLVLAWGSALFSFKTPARITGFFILFLLTVQPLQAQNPESDNLYADGLYMAYMRTGNPSVDAISHKGLDSLAQVLRQRTSVEPAGTVGLNPEYDELAFFPIIYWPITEGQPILSPKAISNIQYYLDHGGTILFDTRDQNYSAGSMRGTKNTNILRRMTSGLNLSPLMPIPKDHVLGKSFYLLDSFPGRYTDGSLWVEQQSANGRDGVSSIIIGSHDWASAWAARRGERSAMSGGARQQEMAVRFGVNLVMYALTGNYKADQVHVPFILERLGQ